MPELPEVETMRIQLERFLVGSTIKKIEVRNPKYEIPNKSKIINSIIIKVRRFAKVTSIDLSNGYSILTHVKLTGQYIYRGPKLNTKDQKLSSKVVGGLGGPHTHIIFELGDGGKLYDEVGRLYYNDIRKFGWVKIVDSEQVTGDRFIKQLGPEPFKDLNFEYFSKLISKSKRNIKVLLMDQSKIGGVGNIYANDALWLSKISPKRTANTLTSKEQKDLYKSIHTVLEAGLKYGGASELAFVTPDGKEGEYQNHTLVYNHTGEICTRCKKEKIQKFFLGGRGTYWCPQCQK